MRFRLRAALLAALVAAAAAGCNGRNGLLGPQYEYEEDLTLVSTVLRRWWSTRRFRRSSRCAGSASIRTRGARADLLAAHVREAYTVPLR